MNKELLRKLKGLTFSELSIISKVLSNNKQWTYFERLYMREKHQYSLLTEASFSRLASVIAENRYNSWVIISAYSPIKYFNSITDYECKSNNENRKEMSDLCSDLESIGYRGFTHLGGRWATNKITNEYEQAVSTCAQPDGRYYDEESVFVPNIILKDAIVMAKNYGVKVINGKKYGQDAIIYYGPETDNKITLYFPENTDKNKIFVKMTLLSMEKYYAANMVGAPESFGRIGGKPPKVQRYPSQGVDQHFMLEIDSYTYSGMAKGYYGNWKQKNSKVYDIIFEILELNPKNIKELMEAL